MKSTADFPQSLLPTCSALVRAAKKTQRLANEFQAADAEFQRQMEDRYGDHGEMPDSIVEATQYGGRGVLITIKWLDAEMASEGYHPNETSAATGSERSENE
jgi:hypothetical protein